MTDSRAESTARFEYAHSETLAARRVDKARAEAGLSERAFCSAVGVNRRTWQRIMNGDAQFRLAFLLSAAAFLEKPPEHFL